MLLILNFCFFLCFCKGGHCSRRHCFRQLTLGVAGATIGTRFLPTHEYSLMKEVIVEAGLHATVCTLALDDVFGTEDEWPPKHNGYSAIVRDLWKGLSLEERQKRSNGGQARNDKEYQLIRAGVGVGLTDEIKNASVRL